MLEILDNDGQKAVKKAADEKDVSTCDKLMPIFYRLAIWSTFTVAMATILMVSDSCLSKF